MQNKNGRRLLLDGLLLGSVLLVSGLLVWRELFNSWYPWDDGGMAHVVDRLLGGQVPHRDFDDPWTGGWDFFQAGIFGILGPTLAALRIPIFAAWLAGLGGTYCLARRFASAILAALITLACASWSLYAWHLPLLNWYYFPLAVWSAWCAIRHTENGHWGWLVACGAGAGLAIDIKSSGFFLLAALLFWSLAQTAYIDRPATREPESPGFGLLAFALATVYSLFVFTLVHRMAGPGASALHFLLPNSALAFWAASEAARARRPLRDGMAVLSRIAGPLVAGVALACAPLILWFAFHGALHDLLLGVFVRPSLRFTRLWGPPPPSKLFTATMLTAPFVLIAGLRSVRAPSVRAAAVTAAALGLLVGVLAHRDAVAVDDTLIMLRSIPIILPLIALWWRIGRSDEMARSTHSLLLVALSVTGTLVQVPSAYLPYFLYAAPLMILAAMSLMAWRRESGSGAIIFFAVFLVAAGAGHPALTATFPPPARWAAVPSPRAGIFVSPTDSARYADLFRLMDTRPPGPVDIEFDAPELYFLMNRPNPRRTVYAILADSAEWSAVPTLRTLDRAGVQTAILTPIHAEPWPAMVQLFAALREHFPRVRSAGGYEVRWRDRDDTSLATKVVPGDQQQRTAERHR